MTDQLIQTTFPISTITLVVTLTILITIFSTFIYRTICCKSPAIRSNTARPFNSTISVQSTPERTITSSELKKATGEDNGPIYVAVKDPFRSRITVFNVEAGRDFYGLNGPYHCFAGRHATYGLATSSTDPNHVEGDLDNLTESQKDTHLQWHAKYMSKYPVVGYLVEDSQEDHEDAAEQNVEKKKEL